MERKNLTQFWLSNDEKRLLRIVSANYNRSMSDYLRYVIRNDAVKLGIKTKRTVAKNELRK